MGVVVAFDDFPSFVEAEEGSVHAEDKGGYTIQQPQPTMAINSLGREKKTFDLS